jgi:hypothetical protein
MKPDNFVKIKADAAQQITSPAAMHSLRRRWVILLKKDFQEDSSNIDSRRASNAQDRFKKSATMIRLLRAGGMLQTFSTASIINCRTPSLATWPQHLQYRTSRHDTIDPAPAVQNSENGAQESRH